MIKAMNNHRSRVLVIGRSMPLIEGVADLLQVVGYPVDVSLSWADTESAMYDRPPGLVIIDLSMAADDAYRTAEQIHGLPHWADVPILFLSFSGDDRIRDLQRQSRGNGDRRVHFYAHSLLGIDRLLETIHACAA
jgi:PleD family two-component response regulator